jgi:hypothetical protein
MTATGTRGRQSTTSVGGVAFRSSSELREILDGVLRQIDADPEQGSRLRAAAGPLQIEFPDLKLVLNVAPASRADHCLQWDFSRRSRSHPRLKLTMESKFANRFLQGRENAAIAMARRRLRMTVEDPAVALRFFPAAGPLFERYRELIAEKYPHLSID